MIEKSIGKIKNVKYNSETNNMEVTIFITDNKFKKKLLRDLSLMGKLSFDGDNVFYNGNIKDTIDG
mgnify:CR=1 FL=1